MKKKCMEKRNGLGDWIVLFSLLFSLFVSFFVNEQENHKLLNAIYIVEGIVAIVYMFFAVVTLINKKRLDWILVKENFLIKVVNIALLIPFLLVLFFTLCEKSKTNENENDFQRNLAKKLVFSESLYEQKIDTIEMDSSEYDNIKKIAWMMDCTIDIDTIGSNKYIISKYSDALPKEYFDKKGEEPSAFWSVYYHYIDPGNQHIASTESGRRWAAVIAICGYVFLNGLLVAVLIGWFDRRREQWIKGEVKYNRFFRKKEHYVIIGGNDMVSGIVKQLLGKNKDVSPYILIQTLKDVESFRRELYSEFTEEEQKKIIIYYGNRTSKPDIEKLYLETAIEVYIVGESMIEEGQNHDAYNMDCLRLITNGLSDVSEKKNVYVIFDNQTTFSSFQFSDISIDDKKNINFIPYNYYEIWAQKIFSFSDPTYIIANSYNKYYPLDIIRTNKNGNLGMSFISKEDPHYVHLVIIGMSKMGVAMGIEAAHVAHYPNALTSKGPRTRITFIDENADRESGYFMNRYCDMFALTRWRYMEADKFNHRSKNKDDKNLYADFSMDDETWHDPLFSDNSTSPYKSMKLGVDGTNEGDEFFIDLEWEFIKGNLSDFSVQQYLRECANKEKHPNKILTVAICLDEMHQSIAGGIYLPDVVYESALQILVYQRFSDSILQYLANSANGNDMGKNERYRNVMSFGMLSETFTSLTTDDYLPKLVNYIYDIEYKMKRADGSYDMTFFENSTDTAIDDAWNKTIEKFDKGKSGCASRWSSIYNSNAIRTKLRSVGWNYSSGLRLDRDDVRLMAMVEHNRWNVEQLLMHYSPVKENELLEMEKLNLSENNTEYKDKKNSLKKKMRHIDICSYNRLDELDKGVSRYDVVLSESLPYIVKRYNSRKN